MSDELKDPRERSAYKPMDEYHKALSKLVAGAWGTPKSEPCFSIPARPEHDADLLIGGALYELNRARKALEAADELANDVIDCFEHGTILEAALNYRQLRGKP